METSDARKRREERERAAHIVELLADGWDEGYEAALLYARGDCGWTKPRNPYRDAS